MEGGLGLDIIRIGIIGVAGVLLAVQFKSGKAEYGIYISIALSLIIFFCVLGHLEAVINLVKTLGGYIRMDTAYVGTLIKMLGRIVLTR